MRVGHCGGIAAILMLAACGSSDTKNAAAEGNQAAAAAAAAGTGSGKGDAASLRLTPGAWDMTVESSGMTGPGLPPEVAKMMKGMKITSRQCITPEEANRPRSDIFTGKQEGNCTYREFNLSAGKLHAAIVCGDKGQGTTTVTSDGQFGGDSFDVRSRIETTGQGQGQAMTVESHVVGKRVGECTGQEKG